MFNYLDGGGNNGALGRVKLVLRSARHENNDRDGWRKYRGMLGNKLEPNDENDKSNSDKTAETIQSCRKKTKPKSIEYKTSHLSNYNLLIMMEGMV